MENNAKLELVFIPCPAPGHIVSTAEFANRLLSHHPQFQVTILLIKSPWRNFPSSRRQQEVNHSDNTDSSRIRYIDLPEIDPPPKQLFHDCPEDFISTYIASHKPHVRSVIDTTANHHKAGGATPTGRLAGIVVDMFSTSMIDVANELNIPSYLFFTSSAAFLGLLLDLPTINIHFNDDDPHHRSVFTDSDSSTDQFSISTFANPVPLSAMPAACYKKSGYEVFSNHGKRFTETKGMIINSFIELEPYATNSLKCNARIPPVYTIGPVLDLKGQARHRQSPNTTQKTRIMEWLDNQPDSSVLFLCFGSGGSFSNPQVKEIANGLMESRVRFLWSLRKPPAGEKLAKPGEYTDTEVNEILPVNFRSYLEEGRGLLCGWAPQVEVLSHKAVGGFMSHCGWNSTLESVWFGKPIVTWPLYAEQHNNAFLIVKELGLGVELRMDYRRERGDLVTSDEIEKAVRCVMNMDNPVRKRVKEIQEISKVVLVDDGGSGSSFKAMECLIQDMVKNLVRD